MYISGIPFAIKIDLKITTSQKEYFTQYLIIELGIKMS